MNIIVGVGFADGAFPRGRRGDGCENNEKTKTPDVLRTSQRPRRSSSSRVFENHWRAAAEFLGGRRPNGAREDTDGFG